LESGSEPDSFTNVSSIDECVHVLRTSYFS
jgi:hypothetical protein